MFVYKVSPSILQKLYQENCENDYEPSYGATIKRQLRRTLVRPVILFSTQKMKLDVTLFTCHLKKTTEDKKSVTSLPAAIVNSFIQMRKNLNSLAVYITK